MSGIEAEREGWARTVAKLTAETGMLRAECERLRAELQEVCRHPSTYDSMPAFCCTCGKELP